MAQTPEQIVSIARLRQEFRLSPNYTGMDKPLEDARSAAIGEISARSGVPLLDAIAEYECSTPIAGS